MMTFDDLEFKDVSLAGMQAEMMFDNGYGVSVIRGPFSIGSKEGLYELAVINSDGIDKTTSVADGGLVGRLTPADVTAYMLRVQQLPA